MADLILLVPVREYIGCLNVDMRVSKTRFLKNDGASEIRFDAKGS